MRTVHILVAANVPQKGQIINGHRDRNSKNPETQYQVAGAFLQKKQKQPKFPTAHLQNGHLASLHPSPLTQASPQIVFKRDAVAFWRDRRHFLEKKVQQEKGMPCRNAPRASEEQ
jgi:hypothetical protein